MRTLSAAFLVITFAVSPIYAEGVYTLSPARIADRGDEISLFNPSVGIEYASSIDDSGSGDWSSGKLFVIENKLLIPRSDENPAEWFFAGGRVFLNPNAIYGFGVDVGTIDWFGEMSQPDDEEDVILQWSVSAGAFDWKWFTMLRVAFGYKIGAFNIKPEGSIGFAGVKKRKNRAGGVVNIGIKVGWGY